MRRTHAEYCLNCVQGHVQVQARACLCCAPPHMPDQARAACAHLFTPAYPKFAAPFAPTRYAGRPPAALHPTPPCAGSSVIPAYTEPEDGALAVVRRAAQLLCLL